MPKKTKVDQEDLSVFYDAMASVKPLKLKRNKILLKPPLSQRKIAKPVLEEEDPLFFDESEPFSSVPGEGFIVFKQSGISHKTLKKLRKGQYSVEAKLDLHGMSVEKAREATKSFLQQSLTRQVRVVLIIHGKGHHSQTPILKNKLNQWLRSLPFVLAFCSASPLHGSRGATYVLLKCVGGDSV
jgi:DNA-nicking Smr family endonuclease